MPNFISTMLFLFLGHLLFSCLGVDAAVEPHVLDVVRSDPQLSSLASIIAKTGGGVENPGMPVKITELICFKQLTISQILNSASTIMAADNHSCSWHQPME
jgi:hypothetical protein